MRRDGDVSRNADPESPTVTKAIAADASSVDLFQRVSDGLPERIGPYRVLEEIGRGGFGIVYRAEQREPVRRVVAIKTLIPGVDTDRVLARFEAERQALAMMNHPGVAKVHDAGATDWGHPYFVMEYVHGPPIHEYCDHRRLSNRKRLELFIQVCEAIQHAHQKGVIHRDIKPSNVLVTETDGTPRVKVIDFGIAKAINLQLTEQTLFTMTGELLGTPEYMSPEQAEGGGAIDIDTRTDVYALGVLLYVLLTGAPPFEPQRLRSAGYREILRILREEEPLRPSTRIGSAADSAQLCKAHGRSDPRALERSLRGDLDWITMKAMEKDRTRRYDSAGAFAEDIRRHLRDETVAAAAPGLGYRAGKFARRNRTLVASTASVIVTLLLAAIVASWLAVAASAARDDEAAARSDADEARAVAERENYRTAVAAASSFLDQHDLGAARKMLERAPPDRRNWEWQHLWTRLDASVRSILAHDDDITDIAIDAPRDQLVTASVDGSLRLWNQATGESNGRLNATAGVHSIEVSGDRVVGLLLDKDQSVGVWRLDVPPPPDGADPVRVRRLGEGAATRLALGAGETLPIAYGTQTGTLAVVEVATGRSIAAIAREDAMPTALAAGPERDRFAVAWSDGVIDVRRFADAARTGGFAAELPPGGTIGSLAFDGTGTVLAGGRRDGAILTWEVATGTVRDRVAGPGPQVFDVAFAPDAAQLAWGAEDGIVRLLPLGAGADPIDLEGHTAFVRAVAFAPDGAHLFSGGNDDTVRTWATDPAAYRRVLTAHPAPVVDMAVAGDAAYGLHFDGVIERWDVAGRVLAARLETGAASVGAGAVDAAHGVAVTGHFDGHLEVHDFADGALLARLDAHADNVTRVLVAPAADVLISASDDGTVMVWTRGRAPKTLRTIRTLPADAASRQVRGVAVDPTRPVVATASFSGRLTLWNLDTGAEIVSRTPDADGGSGLLNVGYTADGSQLAAGDDRGILWLLDPRSLETRQRIDTSVTEVRAIVFSPDASRIACATDDNLVRLFDTADGAHLLSLAGHRQEIRRLAFVGEPAILVSASIDGAIRIWPRNR